MCGLRPTDRRFLPDTITVFNQLSADKNTYIPTVLEFVNFNQANSYTQRQTGIETALTFRVIVDAVNTSAWDNKVRVNAAEWQALAGEQQENGFYCLHTGMFLFKGVHSDFSGDPVSVKLLTTAEFTKRGLTLLKTKIADASGLGETHNIQLAG